MPKWDYAEMTKDAKKYGGPDKYVKHIQMDSGIKSALLTAGVLLLPKGIKFVSEKIRDHERNVRLSKAILINGMEEAERESLNEKRND